MSTSQTRVTTSSHEAAWANLLEQGIALYGQGRMQQSVTIFNHLISSNVHVGEALYGRGLIRLAAGDMDGAASDLMLALQYKPLYGNAFYVLGTIAERRTAWDTARFYYSQALAVDPTLADARARLEQLAMIQASQIPRVPTPRTATSRKIDRASFWTIIVGTAVVLALVVFLFIFGSTFPTGQSGQSTPGLVIFALFLLVGWTIGAIGIVRRSRSAAR